jgi:hypothetical protein
LGEVRYAVGPTVCVYDNQVARMRTVIFLCMAGPSSTCISMNKLSVNLRAVFRCHQTLHGGSG